MVSGLFVLSLTSRSFTIWKLYRIIRNRAFYVPGGNVLCQGLHALPSIVVAQRAWALLELKSKRTSKQGQICSSFACGSILILETVRDASISRDAV